MLSSSGSLVLVPLRHWYYISFLNVLGLLPFYFHISGLACYVVVFSYPVRWRFTCFSHPFSINCILVFSVSQFVTTWSVPLWDKTSGRTMGVPIDVAG